MPSVKCLGSSSSGNCFIIDCDGEKLILDLGVNWNTILSGLEYDISAVVGCFVTHSHSDHSKSIPKALYYCLDVYSCAGVAEKHEGVKVLEKNKIFRAGNYGVMPLTLKHNVENYGYLIHHPSMGKLIYAVDCESFPYNVKGCAHWILEANYDDSIIIDRICANEYTRSASENHLSIDRTIDTLQRNAEGISTIILSHLSDGNSNAALFKRRVSDATGVENVYVATKGLEVQI